MARDHGRAPPGERRVPPDSSTKAVDDKNTPKSLTRGCEVLIQPGLAGAESTSGKGLEGETTHTHTQTQAFQFSKQLHFKDNPFLNFAKENVSNFPRINNTSLFCACGMGTADLLGTNDHPEKKWKEQGRSKSHYLLSDLFRAEMRC